MQNMTRTEQAEFHRLLQTAMDNISDTEQIL